MSVGGWVNSTPSAVSRSYSCCTSATANEVNGIPSATMAALNCLEAGWPSGSSNSSTPSGCEGDTTVSQLLPPPSGTSVLLHKAEDLCVEAQGFGLVVGPDAAHVDDHNGSSVFCLRHRSAKRSSGSVLMWWNLYRPCRRDPTSPAVSSTSRCCEMACLEEAS
jgi:hypothetical protein